MIMKIIKLTSQCFHTPPPLLSSTPCFQGRALEIHKCGVVGFVWVLIQG